MFLKTFLQLTSFTPALVIGVVYRPPNACPSFLEVLTDFVYKIKQKHPLFLMAGDFNLPSVDWESFSSNSTNCPSTSILIDIAFNNNLLQIVNGPTRITASCNSTLDLAFIADMIAARNYECNVVEGISDHQMVVVEISTSGTKQSTRKQNNPTLIFNFSKAEDESIIDALELSLDMF